MGLGFEIGKVNDEIDEIDFIKEVNDEIEIYYCGWKIYYFPTSSSGSSKIKL